MKECFWLRSEAEIESRYEIVRVGADYVLNENHEIIGIREPTVPYLLRPKREKLAVVVD